MESLCYFVSKKSQDTQGSTLPMTDRVSKFLDDGDGIIVYPTNGVFSTNTHFQKNRSIPVRNINLLPSSEKQNKVLHKRAKE